MPPWAANATSYLLPLLLQQQQQPICNWTLRERTPRLAGNYRAGTRSETKERVRHWHDWLLGLRLGSGTEPRYAAPYGVRRQALGAK